MTNEEAAHRKLAAILAADVVGYSRMMGTDEIGTLRRLKQLRRDVIDPTIDAYQGRLVKTTGDGLLVEFPSAVEAVTCAITLQHSLASRNETVARDKRIVYRLGINVGDIIIDGDDIFGDGVNIAARLEALCEPGGLCISGTAHNHVRDNVPVEFDDLGIQAVKNIARPVHIFGVSAEKISAIPAPATERRVSKIRFRKGRIRILGGVLFAVAIIAVVAGSGYWLIVRSPESTAPPQTGDLTPGDPKAPKTTRATIAVLPFASLSDEDSSKYFADGLTEDVISALGRFHDLSVISPSSVFAYKGKRPTPDEVGRDLKVRYVVEGSVRRSQQQVRVSVSLTDTAHGVLLWSDTYDSESGEILSLQDRITLNIAGSLANQVTSFELARSEAKPPTNLAAYDLVLQGRNLHSRARRDDNAQARTLFERATELDPNYAAAYVGLGWVDITAMTHGWTATPRAALDRAESYARKALELDDFSPGAHSLLGTVALYLGDYERALNELNRAIDINGSDTKAYGSLVAVRLWTGDIQGAIAAAELLIQLQPVMTPVDVFNLATAYLLADRGSDAVRILEQARDRNAINAFGNIILAAAYAQTGREAEAERQVEIVHRQFPVFSRQDFGSLQRDPRLRKKLANALEKAGL